MTQQGRWTREPAGQGDDPAEVSAEHYDEEHVRHMEEQRPLVNDQPASGHQGTSSDKPGVDGGGYPEEPPAEHSDGENSEIGSDVEHPTGEEQAQENRETESPS